MEENKKIRSGNYINNVEIQLAGMYCCVNAPFTDK